MTENTENTVIQGGEQNTPQPGYQLPVIKEEMADLPDIAELEKVIVNPEVKPDGNNKSAENNQNAPVGDYTPVYKNIWDDIKTRVEGVELPEKLQTGKFEEGETEFDVLLDFIYNNTEWEPDALPANIHPAVKQLYEESLKPGFNPDNYQPQQQQVDWNKPLQMPNRDFMKDYLTEIEGKSEKRPHGLTSEEIDARIQRMESSGVLEVEATRLKGEYKQKVDSYLQTQKAKQARQMESERIRVSENQTKIIENLKTQYKGAKDFAGISMGESQKKEFLDVFVPGMLAIDPKTGEQKLLKYLKSNDGLMNTLALAYIGDAGLRAQFSDLKETTKASLLDRLDPQARQYGGQFHIDEAPSAKDFE